MGADCCGHEATFEGLSPDYKRRLWFVIAINAAMFLAEMAGGALAGSQALQADALDFLGDATTYGISLAVIGTSIQIRARAAILKALSLTAMGLWVLGSTAYHVLILGVPLMAGLFLTSSIQILRQSFKEISKAHPSPAE